MFYFSFQNRSFLHWHHIYTEFFPVSSQFSSLFRNLFISYYPTFSGRLVILHIITFQNPLVLSLLSFIYHDRTLFCILYSVSFCYTPRSSCSQLCLFAVLFTICRQHNIIREQLKLFRICPLLAAEYKPYLTQSSVHPLAITHTHTLTIRYKVYYYTVMKYC